VILVKPASAIKEKVDVERVEMNKL